MTWQTRYKICDVLLRAVEEHFSQMHCFNDKEAVADMRRNIRRTLQKHG